MREAPEDAPLAMDKFPARGSRQGRKPGGPGGPGGPAPHTLAPPPAALDSVTLPDRASVIGEAGNRKGLAGAGGRKGAKGGPGGAAGPSEADRLFKLRLVERSAEQVLAEKLKDVQYDGNACRDMSPEVAAAIVARLREFCLTQYKLVCVVSLGSLREKPGVQFGSRCLWNKDTDNFASVKYSNGSVYAVALIFGLYFENTD